MNSSPQIWPLLALVAVVLTLALAEHLLARRRLFAWARDAGLELTSAEKRYSRSGPFHGKHWQGQFVYKVCAVDFQGNARTGWVRIGHRLFGVLIDDLDVIWDGKEDQCSDRSARPSS